MSFEKYFLSFFTIIFLYCTCYCESGVNEIYKNNVLEFSSPGIESLFLTHEEDLYNDSDWSADAEECKCKNGRCENTCAEWKDGACRRTKQVCVCDPEFGKYDDHTCLYCDCGKGFNCTINRSRRGNTKTCTCPEGYYEHSLNCAAFCSEHQPCLNGGTCQNGKCNCMSGTHGPFCERIVWCAYECRPRLIVDCVYNQKDENYGCLCKNRSLVFDYKERLCKPCPCGEGTCKEERHELKCDCKVGYRDFEGKCRKCDCGPGHDCELHWQSGEKICKCRQKYFLREGTCLPCECGHKEATCSLDNVGRKVCICPDGYEDKFGLCEKKKGNCTCHPTAKCIETDEGFTCACEDGYKGEVRKQPEPGEPCIDIDECSPQVCPQNENQKCVNFPGSFMCQCGTGYRPVGGTDEFGKITCEKYKVSWLPTGITVGVIITLIVISVGFIIFLKKRDSSSIASLFELRGSR